MESTFVDIFSTLTIETESNETFTDYNEISFVKREIKAQLLPSLWRDNPRSCRRIKIGEKKKKPSKEASKYIHVCRGLQKRN